jgi:putative PIN family toxin of toxin-antitoxin system
MSGDPPRVRAVFDCMIFLQGAARRESPAGICLLLVELGAVELYLSPEIINELRDVLTRPRLRVRFPALTDHLVNEFLKSLERQAVLIPDVPRIFSYERDPKDEPYINLALAANATHLVSRDKDVLDLAKQSNPEGERLRKNSATLRIVDPITFLLDLLDQP